MHSLGGWSACRCSGHTCPGAKNTTGVSTQRPSNMMVVLALCQNKKATPRNRTSAGPCRPCACNNCSSALLVHIESHSTAHMVLALSIKNNAENHVPAQGQHIRTCVCAATNATRSTNARHTTNKQASKTVQKTDHIKSLSPHARIGCVLVLTVCNTVL